MNGFLGANATKVLFALKHITKRIWFRASIYGFVGVCTAFVGLFATDWVPLGTASRIGSDSVGNILAILASSMLAVATFSLSIMATAFGNVSSTASPRASRLLIENQQAQRAVATFIGAFLYSVVGIIALATGAYGEQGRFVLFIVTILVILLIVATLIRWVDQLATLGRVGHTITQVEVATRAVLTERARSPFLGGVKKTGAINFANHYRSTDVGFVVFVNMAALDALALELKTVFSLEILPGSFAYPDRALISSRESLEPSDVERLLHHIVIEPARTFDQDPSFGFILLSEISSRALSAAINDPGTVIEVLGASTRLLNEWTTSVKNAGEPVVSFPHVFVPALRDSEFLTDLYLPLIRDGAGLLELDIWTLKSLSALRGHATGEFAEQIESLLGFVRESAKMRLSSDYEKAWLERVLTKR